MKTLVADIGQRWEFEVLFADVRELLGIGQCQKQRAEVWLMAEIEASFSPG